MAQAGSHLNEEIFFVCAAEEALTASLVMSPGYGVIDSGCGKTLVGEETLRAMEPMLGGRPIKKTWERNSFRFGNGMAEDSNTSACIPVAIGEKVGRINAAIIKRRAPLLLGRPTLEKLAMRIDFAAGTARILDGADSVPLERNSAGQLLINLTEFPPGRNKAQETALSVETFELSVWESPTSTRPPVQKIAQCQDEGAKVRFASRRVERQVLQQWKKQHKKGPQKSNNIVVAELFSPPRFKAEAERLGYRGLSFDVLQGWDLTDPEVQREVDRMLERSRPSLQALGRMV